MRRLLALAVVTVSVILLGAAPAAAHPLGNFSINYSSGLRVEPSAVEVLVVVDSAEIPTLQTFPQLRESPDGVSEAEQQAYAARECATVREDARLEIADQTSELSVVDTEVSFPVGTAGLHTTRLECRLRTSDAVDTVGSTITYQAGYTGERVGWREVTAVGDGVTLASSDVPAQSPSQVLTEYPQDLLSSPLDVRSAQLSVAAGSGVVSGGDDGSGGITAGLPRSAGRLTDAYTNLIGRSQLTVGFGLLAVLLATVIGGAHAFAPGHGKSLMAAYLIGKNGSLRQAAVIGLSVTATHTLGVLILGVVLSTVIVAAPERVYPWLALVSGLLLAGIGFALLRNALHARAHRAAAAQGSPHGEDASTAIDKTRSVALVGHHSSGQAEGHGHDHDHGHDHSHDPGHDHDHGHDHTHDHDRGHDLDRDSGHDHTHDHDPGQDHTHDHDHDDDHASPTRHSHGLFSHTHPPANPVGPTTMRELVAVGLVGGMVPSPSALLVLLGGIALHRAWFGVLLVIAYGVGMALALMATGLLLVRARGLLERTLARRPGRGGGVVLAMGAALPLATALVVVVVGVVLAGRAAITLV